MLGLNLAKGFGESSVVSSSSSNSAVMGMCNKQKFNACKSLSQLDTHLEMKDKIILSNGG